MAVAGAATGIFAAGTDNEKLRPGSSVGDMIGEVRSTTAVRMAVARAACDGAWPPATVDTMRREASGEEIRIDDWGKAFGEIVGELGEIGNWNGEMIGDWNGVAGAVLIAEDGPYVIVLGDAYVVVGRDAARKRGGAEARGPSTGTTV